LEEEIDEEDPEGCVDKDVESEERARVVTSSARDEICESVRWSALRIAQRVGNQRDSPEIATFER
jgi:hypothetical protein